MADAVAGLSSAAAAQSPRIEIAAAGQKTKARSPLAPQFLSLGQLSVWAVLWLGLKEMRQQASFFREGASHGQCPCRPCSFHSCACVSVSTGAPTIAIFAIRLQFSDTKYLGHSSVKRSVYFPSIFLYLIEKFTN